jgi:DNA polymerase-3 subunit gamma/tau
MLTKESFNAFLKTLEEPPSQTIFIFATTDVHKVPLTIISRCQRFDFRRIEMETIKSLLIKIAESEKIEIDDKTLTLIARKADGALRDAESYFDQVVSFCGNKIDSTTVSKILNLIDDEVYFLISDAVLDKNFKSVFEATDVVYKNGWNFTDFMDGLIEHFRNIMTVIITENTKSIETAEVFRKRYLDYIDKFSEGDILRLLNYLNKTGQELRYSQNQKLKIEIALSHLVGLERTSTISELIENLNSGKIELPVSPEQSRIQLGKVQSQKKSPVIPDKNIPETKKIISYKDPVQEPQQNYSSHISSDFDSIVKKWKEFASLISEEKKITLGNFFTTSLPVDLSGNKLSLQFKNNEEIKSFSLNEDYLTKKAHEYFGKKLQFKAIEGNFIKAEKNEHSGIKAESNTGESARTDDQYVDLIINELGGEEIS